MNKLVFRELGSETLDNQLFSNTLEAVVYIQMVILGDNLLTKFHVVYF